MPDLPRAAAATSDPASLAGYEDLDLSVGPDGEIHAQSSQGEAGPARLELDRNELDLALALVEREQTNSELVKALGERLYEALFPPAIFAHLERTRSAAPNRQVRLRLDLGTSELAALPWELMHDGKRFLGLDPATSIVRYTKVEEPLRSLSVDGPLRVLIAVASPTNFPGIARDSLVQAMKALFSQAQTEGRLDVQFLEHATYAGLVRMLRSGEYHVLHFFGYTGTNNTTGQPVLLLEDENGTARRIDADDLAALLYQEDAGRLLKRERSLRLVVLNDVEAEVSATRNFSYDVATALLRSGIPAAVAVQHSLPVSASLQFAAEFYTAVAQGLTVDAAVVNGRRAICNETPGEQRAASEQTAAGEWAAPVLLLHAKDGQLFQPQQLQNLAFLASSVEVYAKIEAFQVETSDGLTRFVLRYLPAFMVLGAVLLAGYWALANQPDLMLISGVAVVLLEVWLLSRLFQRRLPETLNALWRQRIIRARNQASLSQEYLAYLTEYNLLLNSRRFVWGGRLLGLAIAGFAVADFKPVSAIEPELMLPLRAALLAFYAPAGWVIGTLLWKMIATVIVTTRLSYRFDLDIRPGHPDGCGGLKILGDLYFEHVKIVLLAGFYVAGWLVLLTFANAVMETHVQVEHSAEAALVASVSNLCAPDGSGPLPVTDGLPASFATAFCSCLAQQPDTELRAEHQQELRCIEATSDVAPSPLIAAADNLLEFYRWLWFYAGLLVLLVVVAIATFLVPVYNTHHIMQRKGSYFRAQAYSLAGEIADLERYSEQHGSASISTSLQISRQLEWLEARYKENVNPPLWPFDAQVKFRFLGSLATMAFSWLLSEIVPVLLSSIRP